MKLLSFFFACWLASAQVIAPVLSATTSPPIAFDAAVDGGSSGGLVLTYAHTITGSPATIIVNVQGDNVATDPTCTHMAGVTYNLVALTLIDKSISAAASIRCQYLYKLDGAASGTHNVIVTATAAQIGAMSVSYVASASTDGHSNNSSTSITTFPSSVTTAAVGTWAIYTGITSSGSVNPVTGTTVRIGNGIYGNSFIADSNGPVGPGSVTLTVSSAGGGPVGWATSMVGIQKP